MADPLAMTFADLWGEVTTVRFNGQRVPSAKRWVNLSYAQTWHAQEWSFRWGRTTVSTTAGSSTLALPADFGAVSYLFTDSASPIQYLTPQEFFKTFYAATDSGTPVYYTVVNGVVSLGPTPNATSSQFEMVYRKKLTGLVNDADVPLLPSEYHYMLVHGALAIGLMNENDFTYAMQKEAYSDALAGLASEYLTDYGGTLQYSADSFGQDGFRTGA